MPPKLEHFQHLHEELPLEKSALEFMMASFPDVKEKEEMRKIIGRYGLTGREQVWFYYFEDSFRFLRFLKLSTLECYCHIVSRLTCYCPCYRNRS